jgi:hypothetical protein
MSRYHSISTNAPNIYHRGQPSQSDKSMKAYGILNNQPKNYSSEPQYSNSPNYLGKKLGGQRTSSYGPMKVFEVQQNQRVFFILIKERKFPPHKEKSKFPAKLPRSRKQPCILA